MADWKSSASISTSSDDVDDNSGSSGGHKNMCGDKWRTVAYSAMRSSEQLDEMANEDGRVTMFCGLFMGNSILPFCIDEETGERFHGLTDQPICGE